jgi:glycosyltransferase involved in cell wall biosynthesis
VPKICLIDTQMCFSPLGGPNFFLVALARHLVARGWSVDVVGQEGPRHEISDALAACGISILDTLWRPWHLPEEKADRLRAWLCERQPDLLLISNCVDVAWLTLPALPPRIRTVSVAHADVSAYYDPVKHYWPFIDRAVGVSPQIVRQLAQLTGDHGDRCLYIPYGVETLDADAIAAKTGKSADRAFRIGYVGRVIEELKRVSRLAPLVTELARRGVPFHFDVIGDGPDRPALQRSFQEHGVGGQVTFHGWLSGASLRQCYAELDAVVLVSDREGLPIALLEAMGHGAVPVVTDVDCGIATVVRDGDNGFRVPPADTQRFADRLEALIHDRGRLGEIQRRSWQTSQAYTTAQMGMSYESLFEELLSPSHPRLPRPDARSFPVLASCRSPYPAWMRKVKSRGKYFYGWLVGAGTAAARPVAGGSGRERP